MTHPIAAINTSMFSDALKLSKWMNSGTMEAVDNSVELVGIPPGIELSFGDRGRLLLSPKMNSDDATILLVDDEDVVLAITQRMLQQDGYTVLEASSAHEALTTSRAHHGDIQLLISDIQMPGMSGVDLAAQLEQERPGIRVLFITGYAGKHESRIKHPVLEKPFSMDTFLVKVAEILGNT